MNTLYDSPIEDLFAFSAEKHLAEGLYLEPQVECPTRYGTFQLDFAARLPGRALGFECDGADFHADVVRDEWRDALIIGTGAVQAVYRFRGCDIVYGVNDCLCVVAALEPQFFSERGHHNLQRLATEYVVAGVSGGIDLLPRPLRTERYGRTYIDVRRMAAENRIVRERNRFAAKITAPSLEALITLAQRGLFRVIAPD